MKHRLLRIGLLYQAGALALVGFWAAFAPKSFYTDFPGGGRHWISADGPFNQHRVRDVGELSLALFVVLVAAAITLSLPLVRASLVAVIVVVPATSGVINPFASTVATLVFALNHVTARPVNVLFAASFSTNVPCEV